MKQPLLTVEIFQHGAPGIADRDAFGHFVGGQVRRHGRKQHLAAVCQRADPLRPVHGQPDIAFAVHQWLPGVEAHPHPHLDAVRPGVRGHLALRFRGCGDRVTGPRKHDKGSIALRVVVAFVVENAIHDRLRVRRGAEVEDERSVAIVRIARAVRIGHIRSSSRR